MKNGLLIDMDGVIYGGDIMIPGADAFIAKLVKEKIPFTFMTNNSQRTPLETVRKLKKLGIAGDRRSCLHQRNGNSKIFGEPKYKGDSLCLGGRRPA
jgi:NagD protein